MYTSANVVGIGLIRLKKYMGQKSLTENLLLRHLLVRYQRFKVQSIVLITIGDLKKNGPQRL